MQAPVEWKISCDLLIAFDCGRVAPEWTAKCAVRRRRAAFLLKILESGFPTVSHHRGNASHERASCSWEALRLGSPSALVQVQLEIVEFFTVIGVSGNAEICGYFSYQEPPVLPFMVESVITTLPV